MGAVVCEDGTASHALQTCEGMDCATPQVELWKTWVWSDLINAKRICRDAVVHIDQRNELKDFGVPARGPEQASRGPGGFRCGLCWTNCRRNFAMCGIVGRCVLMFPIECVLKVGMHSSLVSCDPVSRMLRLNGLLYSNRWNWLHLT